MEGNKGLANVWAKDDTREANRTRVGKRNATYEIDGKPARQRQ